MNSHSNKVALITGANKGIGFEVARRLGLENITVYIGARNKKRGAEAVARLLPEGIDARLLNLDLNDSESIHIARRVLEEHHGVLDILVNNAGVIDAADGFPSIVDLKAVRRTFDTNFFGALELTQAMLPLLKRSVAGRVVNVSSGLGSLTLNRDPEWEFVSTKLIGYNASKAALNMLTVQLAWELQDTHIKVNSANPGYTNTDLVPGAQGGQPIENGARTAIRLALLPDDGPTGRFFENEGPVPW